MIYAIHYCNIKHYNSILRIRRFWFVTMIIFDVKCNEKYNLLNFFAIACSKIE